MNKKILCCIPARFNSTRLPGKPLLKINNKTIINHVYDKVKETIVDHIVILTDDKRIYNEVKSFNGDCVIVKEECLNGTERIIKYLHKIDHYSFNIIINVQGDEPFIDPLVINNTLHNYIKQKPVCSTVCFKTNNKEEILSKSRGKVVVDNNNNIMYCSRNVIPSNKKNEIIEGHQYNIHVGIFVYDKKYLLEHFIKDTTINQLLEDIEWLKIIEQGFKVNTIFSKESERGVDTIDDFNYLKNKYSNLDYFIENLNIKNIKTDPLRYLLNNNIIKKDGLWLEFGVSYGGTIDLISEYTNSYVYGFDTFAGVDKIGDWKPLYSTINDNGIPEKVAQLDNYDYKKTGIIKSFNNNVKFIKGYFHDTLSNFLKEKNKKISFIHIDCTFYESTKCVLNECLDYFDNEVIIIFNGFVNHPLYKQCEILSFFEFINNNNNINYEFIGMNGTVIANEDSIKRLHAERKNNWYNNNNDHNIYNKSVAVKIRMI